MSFVRVRLLSGDCVDIEMEPDMTLQKLRARVEEASPVVPHFHDIKLLAGLCELIDDDAIVKLELLELQSLVVASPAKAIAKLVQVSQGNKDVWDNT